MVFGGGFEVPQNKPASSIRGSEKAGINVFEKKMMMSHFRGKFAELLMKCMC